MTPAPRFADRSYDSFGAFYRDVYGHAVSDLRRVGRVGATLVAATQQAGDWSDAPVPELVVTRLTTAPVRASMDLGAGRFSGTQLQGQFIVVAPAVATTILMDGRHGLTAIAIPYRSLLALAGTESGLPQDGDFGPLHTRYNQDCEVARLIGRLWTEAKSEFSHAALYADGALLQLAGALLRLRDRASRNASTVLAPWQAKRATAFLADNLASDVGLCELAATVGLSPYHFARAFKATVGEPPHRYLMTLRVERAKQMLAGTDEPVTTIAHACGFASSQHFAAVFRRLAGVTPTEYRRQARL
ncbi:AraC family transcriptional regulator [Tistrella mobilis]|uniref:AraC family transcriptional regulator n=1 Tax=Tistrella mobilis TaxID=171437 RepID=UPI00068514DA|nr:AraC family transcriptional regulator [Tistrella mobilis]